jgi:hypothetical protein
MRLTIGGEKAGRGRRRSSGAMPSSGQEELSLTPKSRQRCSVLQVHIRAAVPRVLSPTESAPQVIPNVTDPNGTSMPAECPELSSPAGGVGVTYTVRFSTGAVWHAVRSSVPAARRRTMARRGNALFLSALGRKISPRAVNTTAGIQVRDSCPPQMVDGNFVHGEAEQYAFLKHIGRA